MADRRALVAAGTLIVGVGLIGGALALYRKAKAPLGPGPVPTTSAGVEELAKKYPRLEKVLTDPKIGSLVKEFVAAYDQGGPTGAKELARQRGLLNKADEITITVLTETDDTAELEAEVVKSRGRVVARGDQQIDIAIPWSVLEEDVKAGKTPDELLERISRIGNVRGVVPTDHPSTHQGSRGGGTTQGIKVIHADAWQKQGFRGGGVRIGVLDPEVSKAPSYIGNVLPASTLLYPGACVGPGGIGVDGEGNHGVAAAEIVHEVAPDAQLFIACSLGDQEAAIDWLVKQGVRIISHSAGAVQGPRNGTGRQQSKINQLAAKGILWVNSAGNEGARFHRGRLQGKAGAWHEFPNGKTAMAFVFGDESELRVTLIWDQWSGKSVSDYDLYLFDANMREIARSENRNTILRQPMEQIQTTGRHGATYYVGVKGSSGVLPANFLINIRGATKLEFPTASGSLGAPADAVGAVAVGAVEWTNDTLAPYSSRGPTEDGRTKPDISAPTGVASIVYKGSFSGTSSAAPHVAGAAAILWGRYPTYSRNDVLSILLSRAKDLGARGPDNEYGAGRLDLGDPATVPAPNPSAVSVPPAPTPTTPAPSPGGGGDVDFPQITIPWGTIAAVIGLGAAGVVVVIAGFVSVISSVFRGSSPRAAPGPRGPFAPPGRGPMGVPVARPVPSPAAPGAAPRWDAALVAIAGPTSGQRVTITLGVPISIGRSPDCTVPVPVSNVSAHHAWVQRTPDGCWVQDGGSRNGTFVNGQRVTQHFLQPGDVIAVGPAQLRFEVFAARGQA